MLRHPTSPRLSVQNEKFLQREIPWGHSGTVLFSSSFLCTPCHLQYSHLLKGSFILKGAPLFRRRRGGGEEKEREEEEGEEGEEERERTERMKQRKGDVEERKKGT